MSERLNVKDLITGTIKFSGSTVSFNEKTFTIKIGENEGISKISPKTMRYNKQIYSNIKSFRLKSEKILCFSS